MSLITFVHRENASSYHSYDEPSPTIYQIQIDDIKSYYQSGSEYVDVLMSKELAVNKNIDRSILHVVANLPKLNKRMDMIELIESLEEVDNDTELLYEVLLNPLSNIEKAQEFEEVFFSEAEMVGYKTFNTKYGIKSEKQDLLKSLFEKVKISGSSVAKARAKARQKV